MNPLIPDAIAAKPTVQKSPDDKLSRFTVFWVSWAVSGAVVEAIALSQDRRTLDRVKRTLSSNSRTLFGWDSITGEPIEVPWGRVRRTAFICLCAWFPAHIQQLGRHSNLEV